MNRKEELKQDISRHRTAINDEVDHLRSTGRKVGFSALVVGGAFLLTYTIVRGIAAGKQQKHQAANSDTPPVVKAQASQKSGIGSKIGGLIMTELTVLLIGLAKNQIKNYFSKLDIEDEESDTE